MDKRWISILIIIIIAVCCGYLVVSSSNTVGSAIVDVNKSTVTLPSDFSIVGSESTNVNLLKRSTSEKIFIKDLGKLDDAKESFDRKLDYFLMTEDIEVLDNKTNLTSEFDCYAIYYQNISDAESANQSDIYVYKYNHTYLLKFSGYSDINQMNHDLDVVVNTLKLDYKKSQE